MSDSVEPQLPPNKPKNIVICLDGTGNQFERKRTNVIKLFQVCRRDAMQLAYYDPGVGTLGDSAFKTRIGRRVDLMLGGAFGLGLMKNVEQAYAYLMGHYQQGDRIFLFGFSRGAYTARVLAGFVSRAGLLEQGCENLIPYAMKLFQQPSPRDEAESKGFHSNQSAFRRTFARRSIDEKGQLDWQIPIHFLGLWDTVKSYGWIDGSLRVPLESGNASVKMIRHAIALDEQRVMFAQMHWQPNSLTQNLREVWFPGVHQDVGGGYLEAESGLSRCSLEWMLAHAKQAQLQCDEQELERIVHGRRKAGERRESDIGRAGRKVGARLAGSEYRAPLAPDALAGDERRRPLAPDPRGLLHRSLRGPWWLAEVLPRQRQSGGRCWWPKSATQLARVLPPCAVINRAVFDRMEKGGPVEGSDSIPDYRPERMPELDKTQLKRLCENQPVLLHAPARLLLLPLADTSREVLLLRLLKADDLGLHHDSDTCAHAIERLAQCCKQAIDETLPATLDDPDVQTYREQFKKLLAVFDVPAVGGPAKSLNGVTARLSALRNTRRIKPAQAQAMRDRCGHLIDALAVVADRGRAAGP